MVSLTSKAACRRRGRSRSSERGLISPVLSRTGLSAITRMALADTRPVRETEQLNWVRMEGWLREQLPSCGIEDLDLSHRMDVEQFPGGHSNLTYLIRFDQTELVVRRPPLGPVAPTAHDMAREFRWLTAVHPVFPLAPRAYLLCDDPA